MNVLAGLVLLLLAAPTSAETITTKTLIHEMAALDRLAEYPSPAFRLKQFSSYDRTSTTASGPGWFANSDGFGNEPVPNFEAVLAAPDANGLGKYLMLDVAGPGAIVRLWTARMEGTLTVYLDGRRSPLYSGSANDFLRYAYEAIAKYRTGSVPDHARLFSQSYAGYYPIPFAKRCRIEWTGDIKKLHFYHVGMRLYEKGADVRTFDAKDILELTDDIRSVAAALKSASALRPRPSPEDEVPLSARIAPGERKEILSIAGEKAISLLTLKLDAPDIEKALRQTVLNIHFDGSPWGQVQAPVGDFFGAGPGVNPYDSLPMTVEPDGRMTSRFVMPFKKNARIVIENMGNEAVTIAGSVSVVKYKWTDGRTMHFRAKWRANHELLALELEPQDIPYLIAQGKGVIVGAAAMLMNPASVPSCWGNWWGEGDEKIFVDDDAFPSIFGTGSEDYFNYAWSSDEIFSEPYCGQPRNDGPGNRGFVSNFRWNILDPIPFHRHLAFYMELFSHEPVPGFSYGRIVYLYGLPGFQDDHVLLTANDTKHLKLPEQWTPVGRKASKDAVFYQTETILAEKQKKTDFLYGPLWAGGRLLAWKPQTKGEQLKLHVPIGQDGDYVFHYTVAKDPQGGIFTAKLNGTQLFYANLYDPLRTMSKNYESKPIGLKKGLCEIVIESQGTQHGGPETWTAAGGIIGLDFLWVQPKR